MRLVSQKINRQRRKSEPRRITSTLRQASHLTIDQNKSFDGAQDKVVGLKSTTEKDLRASEVRGKSIGQDLESKYEAAKGTARDNLNRARESTENLYQEARSSAEQKTHEARELAEKQAAEAKRGWFSWWGRK